MHRIVRHFGRVGTIAAIVLALGACDHPWVENQRIMLGGWTQERMLADGWLKAPPPRAVPVRCHETLADPDCYAVRAKRKDKPTKREPHAAKDK